MNLNELQICKKRVSTHKSIIFENLSYLKTNKNGNIDYGLPHFMTIAKESLAKKDFENKAAMPKLKLDRPNAQWK